MKNRIVSYRGSEWRAARLSATARVPTTDISPLRSNQRSRACIISLLCFACLFLFTNNYEKFSRRRRRTRKEGSKTRRETTLPSLPPHPASCFLARKNIFVLLNRCSLNDKWLATANPSATTISPRTLTWCLPISIASTSFFYDFQPERIRLRCFRPLQFGERIPVNGRAKFRNFSINLSRIHFRGKEIKREKEISGIYMEYLEYFRRFAGRTNERNIFYTRCVLQFL